jgi:hypothetical protein
MMADRQLTLAPFFGPPGRQARGRLQTPTIARSLNAASGFERSSVHYDERRADKEAELSTSCPSEGQTAPIRGRQSRFSRAPRRQRGGTSRSAAEV